MCQKYSFVAKQISFYFTAFKWDPLIQNMLKNVRLRCIWKSLRISKKLEIDMTLRQRKDFVNFLWPFKRILLNGHKVHQILYDN